MAKHIESELKYRLTKKKYEKLLAVTRSRRVGRYRLINCYYDDDRWTLRRNRVGFRLRIINGKSAVLTLKEPSLKRPFGPRALKVRREYEQNVPMETARALRNGTQHPATLNTLPTRRLRNLLPRKKLERLRIIGEMKMVRTKALVGETLEIEIDRFEIFGKKYYELEIETITPKETDALIRAFFKQHRIPSKPLLMSKLERLMRTIAGKRTR